MNMDSSSVSWAPGKVLSGCSRVGPSFAIDFGKALSKPVKALYLRSVVLFENRDISARELSQEYRSLMLDCRAELLTIDCNIEAAKLHECSLVWAFMEEIFMHETDDHLSLRLERWYHVCFNDLSLRADEMLEAIFNGDSVEDDKFWDIVSGLTACGARGKAFELVSARSDEKEWSVSGASSLGVISEDLSPCSIVCRLLANCPAELIASRRDGSWDSWQKLCLDWKNSDELKNRPVIRRLLGLLGGDMNCASEVCRDWAQMLVCASSYACTTGAHSLRGDIKDACAEASSYFDPPRLANGSLTEAALDAPGRAIFALSTFVDTPWIAAHLCDVLVRARVFPQRGPLDWTSLDIDDSGMQNHFLCEYARSIEGHRGLWRVAATYYDACGVDGVSLAKSMLTRIPFYGSADRTAEKVVQFAVDRNWTDVMQTICKRLGSDSLSRRQYATAFSWYAQGNCTNQCWEVVGEAISNAEREGAAASCSLEALVRAIFAAADDELSRALVYVRLYAEFLTCLKNPDAHNTAIPKLLKLIGGGGLSRRYWLMLLIDAKFLFADSSTVLDVETAQKLLIALELCTGKSATPEMMVGLQKRVEFVQSHQRDLNCAESGKLVSSWIRGTRDALMNAAACSVLHY